MKIVIAGGTGNPGGLLASHFHAHLHAVTVLTRHPAQARWRTLGWDGKSIGPWTRAIEGADLLLNLAGCSVNCRYHAANRWAIKESRIRTTRLLGEAVAHAADPPRIWMNSSTATIYRHALDRDMDERTGELGGNEPGAPPEWNFSIDVARSWEEAFFESAAPRTRRIALRSAMVMSPAPGGVFELLLRLVRLGLGGAAGSGRQYVSWIHDVDFVAAIEFLIARPELDGVVNIAAPQPLPNRDFMRILRESTGVPFGLPARRWMLEIAAVVHRTETELLLKSRRAVPGRLLAAGFSFRFPDWQSGARDLVERSRRSTAASPLPVVGVPG